MRKAKLTPRGAQDLACPVLYCLRGLSEAGEGRCVSVRCLLRLGRSVNPSLEVGRIIAIVQSERLL